MQWYTLNTMNRILLRAVLLMLPLLAVSAVHSSSASAAAPALLPGWSTKLGNDVSWPQCNKRLPIGQTFGIVGVNGGVANTTNPCLPIELFWANASGGGTGQPLKALYVNTGNPGKQGSWWPTSNYYGSMDITNPYGTCTGNADAACAYMYGYAKAYDDATIRGVVNPSGFLWWLDIETTNTWQTDKTDNTADLEGMTAYFHSIGAEVGLYSTGYQWSQIAGSPGPGSTLYNLKSWLAGASSQADAKTMCSAKPLTGGSSVAVTQFVHNNLDYDYSCI